MNIQEKKRFMYQIPHMKIKVSSAVVSRGSSKPPRGTVWTVLCDYTNYHKFFPRLLVAYIVDDGVLNKIGKKQEWKRAEFEALISKNKLAVPVANTFYVYNVIDMPFPFPDRWMLLKMEINPEQYKMYWKMIYGNMLIIDGSWELKQYGCSSSETLAVYTAYSKSFISIPAFIMNIGFNNTLPDIIKGLRRRVGEVNIICEHNK